MILAPGQVLFDVKLKWLHRALAVAQVLVIFGIVGLTWSNISWDQSSGGTQLVLTFINIFGIWHAFAFLRTQVGTPIQVQGFGVLLGAFTMYVLNVVYGLPAVVFDFTTPLNGWIYEIRPYLTILILAGANIYFFMVVKILGYCYRLKRQQVKGNV